MATAYSFGYKMNGEDQFAVTGPDAPVIYDCRGIKNPHSDPKLRSLSGRDPDVRHAVMKDPLARIILHRATTNLRNGRNVAFGCAYGKHRSVALAEAVGRCVPGTIVVHTGAAKEAR